jgi:hypothetical protein
MAGMQHHDQLFSVEMGSSRLFCPGWLGIKILLIFSLPKWLGLQAWATCAQLKNIFIINILD